MAMGPAPLVDDLMREIFLRLPPGDPRALVRAAAGCRTWRGLISDATFAHNYREHHGAPPMLGFLYDECYNDHGMYWISHFASTVSFRPAAGEDRENWRVLDSRHGLALFYTPTLDEEFVVCDLVTGDQWEIDADPKFYNIMWWEHDEEEYKYASIHCNASVICAKDRCDHLDCHGGPFRIALVGSTANGSVARATIYSSEAGEWSDMIEFHTPDNIDGSGHSAVVGNKVYVPCLESDSVVEYNMGEEELSVINCPFEEQDHNQPYIRLMGVEDGMLLFASVVKPTLYLWSMVAGPSGVAGWARRRVIELEPLLPPDVVSNMSRVLPVGFAEGVSVIFLKTRNGIYTIDLNSGERRKVCERNYIDKVMPYMSFYTGAWGQLPNLE